MQTGTVRRATDGTRRQHVERLGADHPPIDLGTVDLTVRRPDVVLSRFGVVLDYMARTELEVERNVLELATVLPAAPEVDEIFYRDVWLPQESRHGLILDELLVAVGHPPAQTDLTTVSMKIRVVGAVAHLTWFQDVARMLYYLTGMTTERSAVMAYHRLAAGLAEMGESALVETAIVPIRRQEPGHFAYYRMSAHDLWSELSAAQRWLVRRLRSRTFAPVGANSDEQRADVGDMMASLGIRTPSAAAAFAQEIARVEHDLLWAQRDGMTVPDYVARSLAEAVELAQARADLRLTA